MWATGEKADETTFAHHYPASYPVFASACLAKFLLLVSTMASGQNKDIHKEYEENIDERR